MAVNRYNGVVWTDTSAGWAGDNIVYAANALLFATDTNTLKRGNGVQKYADLQFIGGNGAAPIGADPSELVGTTNIPGSAVTFMRSDAAPAVNQAITPTWTNAHVFTARITNILASTGNNGPGVMLSSMLPQLMFEKTDGGVDAKRWALSAVAGDIFSIRAYSDNNSSFLSAYQIERIGTQVTIHRFYTSNIVRLNINDTGVQVASLSGTGIRTVVASATGLLQSGSPAPISGSSPSLTFPDVPANGFLDLGFTITGSAIGDCVALGVPGAAQVDGVTFTALVSNTNVITVRCHNFTGSPITVPAGIYNAVVFKI